MPADRFKFSSSQGGRVRILTYNIHGWRSAADPGKLNLDALTQIIGDANADLVGLNEVFHPLPANGGPALALLAARLGMTFAFGPTIAAAATPTGIPYGNAVLSRWPILAHAAHHLSAGINGEPRGLLEARVLTPTGRPFTLYVTHLDHRSEAVRLAQWRAASAWLTRERGKRHLVVGDFNALATADYPQARALAELQAVRAARGWPAPAFDVVAQVEKTGYCDAFAQVGAGEGATFPASAPEIRIDYIFLPTDWADGVTACRRWDHPLTAGASDHIPLFAEFA
jgi:endonuclease/exonuclease/phosphatase family metal-dependent hydrolase